MSKRFIFFLIILGFISSSTEAVGQSKAKALYTIEDLIVLDKEDEFKEFFDHTKDILPSERNTKWKEMVKSMAQRMMKTPRYKANISKSNFEYLVEVSQIKILREDEFFQESKDRIYLVYFKQCLQKNFKKCDNIIKDLSSKYGFSKKLGVNIAELYWQNGVKTNLSRFALPMAQSSLGEFYCGKYPLNEILINEIYTDQTSRSLIHKDCLKVLKPTLIKNLHSNSTAMTRYNTHKILLSLNSLSPSDETLYLIIQLLEGFNLEPAQTLKAFELLNEIYQSSKKREKIFNILKMKIPLFGKVFSLDSKSSTAIILGLTRYFPEYIDYYSSTCLEHLSGKKTTSGGNPATYCHPFFKKAKKLDIVPSSKSIQYEKLIKF